MRETTKRWISQNISVDGEGVDWVLEPKGVIKKANLTFMDKFLWILVRHCLSPTVADNIFTGDIAVLIAAMVSGFEVDFAWLLQAVIHERSFTATTTYPFSCMIFELCRSTEVPVWHIYMIKTPTGIVDIDLIRDEANELDPNRGPQAEVQLIGENF